MFRKNKLINKQMNINAKQTRFLLRLGLKSVVGDQSSTFRLKNTSSLVYDFLTYGRARKSQQVKSYVATSESLPQFPSPFGVT